MFQLLNRLSIPYLMIGTLFVSNAFAQKNELSENISPTKRVIVIVWDGLRPDAVDTKHTPNLYRFMKSGVQFLDHHSTFPTLTMMNAASFATGDRAGKTGFFGNMLWAPYATSVTTSVNATPVDATHEPIDFRQPVFTEDYQILKDLSEQTLFYADTLFHVAHEKGLLTATFGKQGPAFLQDYREEGIILDPMTIVPKMFAETLDAEPPKPDQLKTLIDGVTINAADKNGSPFNDIDAYMINTYIEHVLLKKSPQLSVIWLKNPDATEHRYGPGAYDYYDALHNNDKIFQILLTALKDNHLDNSTNIVVVSDHAQSSVSGPQKIFPLRTIGEGVIGKSHVNGFSVSGEVRLADMLTQAGFHAYDGEGCRFNPVMSGILKDGTPFMPMKIDESGKICGHVGQNYTTPAYLVPEKYPNDAIVIAINGGANYFYIPSHDKAVVKKLVRFLASRPEISSIFADDTRYGILSGTLSLASIGVQNGEGRNPDVIVGMTYDTKAKVNNLPGTEFSDSSNLRGTHGSFSPVDVHNFMAARGPDFRSAFIDTLPSGNIDLAPTLAKILNLNLSNTDGRVLYEVLQNQTKLPYRTKKRVLKSTTPLTKLKIVDLFGKSTSKTQFETILYTVYLQGDKKEYVYFEKADNQRR